jgi:hypothetical protein
VIRGPPGAVLPVQVLIDFGTPQPELKGVVA